MILPFSTKLNGKETNFVSKIWRSLTPMFSEYSTKGIPILKYSAEYDECLTRGLLSWYQQKPKHHTIREDKNDRWQVGMIIDFYINVRTKLMFRFAPKLAVKSIQKVSILWSGTEINTCTIWIDENCYVANYSVEYNSSQQRQQKMEQLSQNDGFDSVQEFLDYFSENFYGKIIHWTDLVY